MTSSTDKPEVHVVNITDILTGLWTRTEKPSQEMTAFRVFIFSDIDDEPNRKLICRYDYEISNKVRDDVPDIMEETNQWMLSKDYMLAEVAHFLVDEYVKVRPIKPADPELGIEYDANYYLESFLKFNDV